MDSSTKVESAKKLCVILLILVYTAWVLTLFFYERSTDLKKVRQICAVGWVKKNPNGFDAKNPRKFSFGRMMMEAKENGTAYTIYFQGDNGGSETQWGFFIKDKTQTPDPTEKEDELIGKSKKRLKALQRFSEYSRILPNMSIEEIRDELVMVTARHKEIKIARKSSINFDESYKEIKDFLYRRQIQIPGVSFATFSPISAVWLISLAMTLLLIIVDNRLHHVIRSGDYGLDEPWLVLDALEFIERVCAFLWGLGLFLAPPVMAMLLVVAFTDVYFTVDTTASWVSRWLVYCYTALAVGISFIESLNIIGRLHRLRKLRISKMEELKALQVAG